MDVIKGTQQTKEERAMGKVAATSVVGAAIMANIVVGYLLFIIVAG
jgi:hypothetical protein